MAMAAAAIAGAPVNLYYPEVWPEGGLPWMSALIADAMETVAPPFIQAWYGDRYRSFTLDPLWLAHSFIANAEKEAEGARKLWIIAGQSHPFGFADAIADHAFDEARHARMYMAMLKFAFPDALEEGARTTILASFPKFRKSELAEIPGRSIDSLLDDIVQMNIGEIRTRLHQMLLRPVALAVCPPGNRAALAESLTRIYDDEGRHILYTAQILETFAEAGKAEQIAVLYHRRLIDFSELTLREVGDGQFD